MAILNLTFIPRIWRHIKQNKQMIFHFLCYYKYLPRCYMAMFMLDEQPLIVSNIILFCELFTLLTGKYCIVTFIKIIKILQ